MGWRANRWEWYHQASGCHPTARHQVCSKETHGRGNSHTMVDPQLTIRPHPGLLSPVPNPNLLMVGDGEGAGALLCPPPQYPQALMDVLDGLLHKLTAQTERLGLAQAAFILCSKVPRHFISTTWYISGWDHLPLGPLPFKLREFIPELPVSGGFWEGVVLRRRARRGSSTYIVVRRLCRRILLKFLPFALKYFGWVRYPTAGTRVSVDRSFSIPESASDNILTTNLIRLVLMKLKEMVKIDLVCLNTDFSCISMIINWAIHLGIYPLG